MHILCMFLLKIIFCSLLRDWISLEMTWWNNCGILLAEGAVNNDTVHRAHAFK